MGYIPHAGYSELPVGDDLVRIYLDAQHDYLQDRVYLLAARVVGPAGEQSVIQMTPSAPTTESEQNLFVNWVTELGEAILACAGSNLTKAHVYVYDAYDQKVILEG